MKKARGRVETALRTMLAESSCSVTQLLVWRNPPCSPEWSCHKIEWETSGFQPKRICMASCINNQAFPAVSSISGNFLIQRAGRQLRSPTCYSWFLCITSIIEKKFLGYVVSQNSLGLLWVKYWRVYRRYLEMVRKYSEHVWLTHNWSLWNIHMYPYQHIRTANIKSDRL